MCRSILGFEKFIPTAAVLWDTGLTPSSIDQWIEITRSWCRVSNIDGSRLNKRIFNWSHRQAICNVKNVIWKTRKFFKQYNLSQFLDPTNVIDKRIAVFKVAKVAFDNFMHKWNDKVNRVESKSKKSGNKLRIYKQCKKEFGTELYVKAVFIDRKA